MIRLGRLIAALSLCFWANVASAEASCFDEIRNGPESDVDCGGDCLPCELGLECRVARDCVSGLCNAGECIEREYVKGSQVPEGYYVEQSRSDAAASARLAGILFFSVSYAGAYSSALILPNRLSANFIPVVGPWLSLDDSSSDLGKALLITDGVFQAAGALLIAGGVAGAGQQLLREPPLDDPALAPRPKKSKSSASLLVLPQLGPSGGGLSFIGSF